MRSLAPVIFFVYNRPWHACKTVEALQKNEFAKKSDLFIFADGPKDGADDKAVQEVREYIRTVDGFKSVVIIEQEKNIGLANSIITGVTKIINGYGRVIVLEDDLVTSPYFLQFMNNGLEFYRNFTNVFSISGYNHPSSLMPMPAYYREDIYFNYRNSSWGWATWKDRWEKADWEVKDYFMFSKSKSAQKQFNRGGADLTSMLIAQMKGRIDSWAIRWSYSHFRNNALAVYPVYSYVNNIGNDGSGTHCGKSAQYTNDLTKGKRHYSFISIFEVDENIMKVFRKVYQHKLSSKLKNIVKILILYRYWERA